MPKQAVLSIFWLIFNTKFEMFLPPGGGEELSVENGEFPGTEVLRGQSG